MNNYKICIIITTFLRDNLLYKTLQTIVDNQSNNCMVLIADQGYDCTEKQITIDYIKSQISCEYHRLPFDCGAYYSRNRMVEIAKQKNIPYCLIAADSIQFKQQYDFQPIIDFLEKDKKTALVGFELEGSKCNWEFLMSLTSDGIQFSYPTETIEFQNIEFTKLDICRNIYLAKTDALLDSPYDEDLKLGGHELNFWNLKQKGWNCYWTNNIVFKRNSSMPKEYAVYRDRLKDFLKIAKRKLGTTGWVHRPIDWKTHKKG